jgi:hypothetical protein
MIEASWFRVVERWRLAIFLADLTVYSHNPPLLGEVGLARVAVCVKAPWIGVWNGGIYLSVMFFGVSHGFALGKAACFT